MYEGIQSDIVSLNRFDENSDISMTYLGRMGTHGKPGQNKGRRIFSYIRKSVLFIIPVIIEVHNHRFEIYTLVSEIHKM